VSAMTHAEALELGGLYVLDALSPGERAQVDAHLASCPESHAEFDELGGVVPALATLADPKGAPASLKNKVLADYRAGAGATAAAGAAVWTAPTSVAAPRPTRQSWLGWAAAAMAVLVIAALAGWGYANQSRANEETQRQQALAQAIDIMSAPGSSVALLRGKDSATGASGFAAFDASGAGYLVVVDLPAAPGGRTYQAWYIASGTPTSAGLVSVDGQGFALLKLSGLPGTEVIALTVEPAGGSDLPSGKPVVDGHLDVHA
jgi:hypothetical protein